MQGDTEDKKTHAAEARVHQQVIEALAQVVAVGTGPKAAAYASFLGDARERMELVMRELEAYFAGQADVGALFRALHTVKAGAHLYRLVFLEHFAHAAEALLDDCRAGHLVMGVTEREQLATDLGTLQLGVETLNVFTRLAAMPADPVRIWESFVESLETAAAELARELGKQARLTVHASHAPVGRDLARIQSVVGHLLRNAVDHGLETAQLRRTRRKSEAGRIVLTLDCVNGCFFGRFEDDGSGIDLAAVVRAGVERGLLPSGSGSLSLGETLNVLASPGLSTRPRANQNSGRGVGLDAVLSELRACGGQLSLERTSARGTAFVFSFPRGEERAVPLASAMDENAA